MGIPAISSMVTAIFIIIIIIITVIKETSGYPTGAPGYTCRSQVPGHFGCEQYEPAPYKVDVTKLVDKAGVITADHRYSVTLEGLDGTPFKGFICAASEAGDTINKPVGKMFISASSTSSSSVPSYTEEIQLLACTRAGADTGVTHTSNSEKHSVQFEWSPPAGSPPGKQYKLRCTMVMDFFQCWTNLKVIIVPEPAYISASATGIVGAIGNSTTGITDPSTHHVPWQ